MSDLIEKIEYALDLFIKGYPREAAQAGQTILSRARGTAHAARVFRYVAEFYHACGQYQQARELATEAGSLSRALRQPDEILASTLVLFACDLYEGQLSVVYQKSQQLLEMNPEQLLSTAFMAQIKITVGDLEPAIALLERANSLLDEQASQATQPAVDLFRSSTYTSLAKAYLLFQKPEEALAILERSLDLELPTQVPSILATAMTALASGQLGREEQAHQTMQIALERAQPISKDLYGHTLAFSGFLSLELDNLSEAIDSLTQSTALLTHQFERQESYFFLGNALHRSNRAAEAETAYRNATLPCTESLFGRNALRALRKMVGLRLV